jgi:hypothetical protein
MKYFALLILVSSATAIYPPCDSENLQWFPHRLDCSRYYLCHHGEVIQRSCAPNLHFNNESGQCMPIGVANCTFECPEIDNPSSPIFLPNPSDCSKFSICYNGRAIGRQCASGLLFDELHDWCNYPEFVNCGERGNVDDMNTEEVTEEVPVNTTFNPDIMVDCHCLVI